MKASIRDEVGNWLSRNRLRIFSIPAVLLAINAVLLSLAGAWNAESFAHLSIYFLAPTVAIVLFRRSGCLIDILILGLLWLPVAFGLVQKNWKFSEYNYSLTALSAVIFAMVVFTTIRKLDFSMDWQLRRQDLKRVLIAYAILAIQLIVVTLLMGFTKFYLLQSSSVFLISANGRADIASRTGRMLPLPQLPAWLTERSSTFAKNVEVGTLWRWPPLFTPPWTSLGLFS